MKGGDHCTCFLPHIGHRNSALDFMPVITSCALLSVVISQDFLLMEIFFRFPVRLLLHFFSLVRAGKAIKHLQSDPEKGIISLWCNESCRVERGFATRIARMGSRSVRDTPRSAAFAFPFVSYHTVRRIARDFWKKSA